METDAYDAAQSIFRGTFDLADIVFLIILLFLLLCSALASASEVAYFSLSEQHTKRYKCDYIAIEIQKYTHWRHLIPVCDKPLYFLQRVKIVSAFIISPSAKHIAENKKVNDTDYIKHKQHRAHSPEFFSIYLLQNITPVRTGLQLYASPLFCQEACLHTLPLTSSEVH